MLQAAAEYPQWVTPDNSEIKKNRQKEVTRASIKEARAGSLVRPSVLRCPLGTQLRRTRLYRRKQRLVGQVAVSRRALVISMPEHLSDGEQIDARVDHERRRLTIVT